MATVACSMPASVYSRVARKREFSTLSLRSAVENGSIETKFFIATLSSVQLVTLAMCCEGQAQIQSTINPLSTPLRSKSLRNQAELHSLGVKVDLNLDACCFPKPHAFVSYLSKPHAFVCRAHARSTDMGNWLPSRLEVPRPTATSRIDFESVRDTTCKCGRCSIPLKPSQVLSDD